MLEDKLLLRIVLKQHGVLIERANFAGELDATDQVNGDRTFVLTHRVEKSVLNVLRRLGIHEGRSPVLYGSR